MTTPHYCANCGTLLRPDWQFCENCRNPVADHQAATVISAPQPGLQAAMPAVPSKVNTGKKQSRLWLIPVLGVGCLCLFCFGVLVVGGFLYLLDQSASPTYADGVPEITVVAEVIIEPTSTLENLATLTAISPTEETQPTETALPAPTDLPVPTETQIADSQPTPDNGLTGNQKRDDTSFFDDFSSKSLDWPEYDDGVTILKYEDEAYSFQITEADYFDWAYFPVDFSPNSVSFEVWGLPGQQDGTFGMMCQFQDIENYYYVEIDLEVNEFVIAQFKADEYIPLTIANDEGQYWHKADPLSASPEQVNQISIECSLDFIVLAINDSLVYATEVSEPFNTPGETAFFVYAFSFAGPEGYKVFFDNVAADWVAE